MYGRRTVNCKRCFIDKPNFGLGMCNACLRNYKRQNKPSFYLGTQYSEIKRRCVTKDDRRDYYGKKYCTKEEYIARFLNDKTFLNQYKVWQKSGFKRGDSPSIDRIDNSGDYLIPNLQILPHRENGPKDRGIKLELNIDGSLIIFNSQRQLAKHLNISVWKIYKIINKNGTNNTGYLFKKV